MIMIRVCAFGALSAQVDGVEVGLGGPRQRAVLGVLVAAGRRVVSTDRFVDELWVDEPPPRAIGVLHSYVSQLRRSMEPDRERRRPAAVLVSKAPGYVLSLPDDAVDTWQFASLVRQAGTSTVPDDTVALIDEAMELWTDTPFAAYQGSDWAAAEIARLSDLRATAVELRATAALTLGRSTAVITDLEQHVRDHPLREQAVRLLALALYRDGRQSEALSTLARARQQLVDELGIDPGPELRQLETDILQQAAHLTAPVAPAVAPVTEQPRPEPPSDDFVGRENELARLRHAAAQVGSRTCVVWVEADAGFGKSTLLERFCDATVGQGLSPAPAPTGSMRWTVARGRCPEVDGAPAGWAWHEVLRDLGAPGHLDHEGGQRPAADLTAGARNAFALARAVQDAVVALGAQRRALIVLDDLHRADEETLQVLRHVANVIRSGLLVVGSFRSHEIGGPLATTLAAVAERTVDRIELGGLDPVASAELLQRYTDRSMTQPTQRLLVERSAGNPLFLRELGQLVAAEGVEDAARELPAAIRDLLLRRINRLPLDTIDTLSRASVLGRDIDFDVLLALESSARPGTSEDDLVDALDTALVAGLLQSPTPGELRFTHALIRDTCYERLAPLRRARLHQTALEVIEERSPGWVDQLAYHSAAGLDRRTAHRAAGHLTAAFDRAYRAGAMAEAIRHAENALRAHELAGTAVEQRLALRRGLVQATAGSGNWVRARRERALSLDLAVAVGTQRDIALAWLWEAPALWNVRDVTVDNSAEVAGLRLSLGQVTVDDPALRVGLLVSLVYETEISDAPTAVAAADEAVSLARRTGDPRLLCQALNAQYLVTFSHPADHLGPVGEELLRVAQSAGLVAYQALAHQILHSVAVGHGDLDLAASHIRAGIQAGNSGQLASLLLAASVFDSTADLLRGDLEKALDGFVRTTRQMQAAGDPNGSIIELFARCTVAWAAGDLSGLIAHIEPFYDVSPDLMHDFMVRALLDAGDDGGARRIWRPAPWRRESTWLMMTSIQADNAHRMGDRAEAERTYRELLPWSGQLARSLNGSLVIGPTDYFLGEAASALGHSGDARRHWELAQRLSKAVGSQPWTRWAQERLESA